MKHAALIIACVALLGGCAGDAPDADEVPADTITQRQRDSVIGASRLPGAQGVRGALKASDAAAARAAALDSAANQP